MAKLVVLSEGFTGRSYELKAEKTTIGRLEDNAFQIAEPSVSSHHCEVLLRGNDVVVKDLNSTNGTYISGERITEAILKGGQILRLGQVELRLETGAPGAPPGRKLDHTTVIPQGVKLDELAGTAKPVFEAGSPFEKKSNKANVVFVIVGIVLGVIIVGLIAFAIYKISLGG
ncbi:MAG: FHA domain-containing protein [Phycisphaerae bacterium]|nr:FHA domain-containing protein [Phycisphaerae bacterium]